MAALPQVCYYHPLYYYTTSHHTPLTVDQESAIFPAVKALLANSTPPSH